MAKFIAPAIIAHFMFDNIAYERDENGIFNIDHPDHAAAAKIHGATEFDPDADGHFAFAGLNGAHDNLGHERELAARDAEIESLRAELSRMREAADATAGAGGATDASGDTSGATGGGSDTQTGGQQSDAVTGPDTENYAEMVAWLKENGAAVPGNISKQAAKDAVEDMLSTLNAGK